MNRDSIKLYAKDLVSSLKYLSVDSPLPLGRVLDLIAVAGRFKNWNAMRARLGSDMTHVVIRERVIDLVSQASGADPERLAETMSDSYRLALQYPESGLLILLGASRAFFQRMAGYLAKARGLQLLDATGKSQGMRSSSRALTSGSARSLVFVSADRLTDLQEWSMMAAAAAGHLVLAHTSAEVASIKDVATLLPSFRRHGAPAPSFFKEGPSYLELESLLRGIISENYVVVASDSAFLGDAFAAVPRFSLKGAAAAPTRTDPPRDAARFGTASVHVGPDDSVLRFRVELPLRDGWDDDCRRVKVWRTIEVPEFYSFWELHVAIQDAMGWAGYHLHQFDVPAGKTGRKTVKIGLPSDEDLDDKLLDGVRIQVSKHLKAIEVRGMAYEYDFGDGWTHSITLEGVFRGDGGIYPRCIAGENACPPEDCGGDSGYFRVLDVLGDKKHPEYGEVKAWLRDHTNVGWPYRPTDFSAEKVHFDDPAARFEFMMSGGD